MFEHDITNSDKIIFGEREVGDGLAIGLVLLNRPRQLNAIDTEMFTALDRQLDRWETDNRIVGLGFAGVGDKGFCAGGDVVSLYKHIRDQNDPDRFANVGSYFEVEYRIDRRIHEWEKPTISVAGGFCLGGGLGLFRGTSHRILHPETAVAMPEVKIGFFPDVGAGWFLQELPPGLGRLLALTGTSITERDARWAGLATAIVDESPDSSIWDQIAELAWTDNTDANYRLVTDFVASVDIGDSIAADKNDYQQHQAELKELAEAATLVEFTATLERLAAHSARFVEPFEALTTVSPLSVAVTDWYLTLSEGRTVQSVLQTDLTLAQRMVKDGDFSEGVRSLLVDKDRNPSWKTGPDGAVEQSLVTQLLHGL